MPKRLNSTFERSVPGYHAYIIDESGHIARPAEIISAETDDEAIEVAKRFVEAHDIELWQADRLVIGIKPEK